MSSTPVIALVLEGDDVVQKIRNMLGVSDSTKSAPGTIRAEHGVDMMINVAHASDSPETAEIEVRRFFKDEELFAYAVKNTEDLKSVCGFKKSLKIWEHGHLFAPI